MKIKKLIPLSIRKWLLKLHQRFVFQRSLKNFEKLVDQDKNIDNQLLGELIYGWGNQGFSAKVNYLKSCIEYARKCQGNILECGSGLTTILLSIIARKRKIKIFALENYRDYGLGIYYQLEKINTTDFAEIKIDDLKDYGDFEWYNVDKLSFNKPFGLVIVDGPPGSTKGGRYGLVPLLKDHFGKDTYFLVDDTTRANEKKMIEMWRELITFTVEYPDKQKAHAVLKAF